MERGRAQPDQRNRIIRHAPMPPDVTQPGDTISSAGNTRVQPNASGSAECDTDGVNRDKNKGSTECLTLEILECSVCLQQCIHPVQLPCKHIFCFLCVKGAAHRSKRCALCRQEIPPEYFQKPTLIRHEDLEKTITFDDKYQWFYEGRNGWWQYDDRTSQEIECKHKNGEKLFELLIAGFLYIVDFENMIQYRRNDRTRKRNIKRDVVTTSGVKGVAGLKYANQVANSSDRLGGDGGEQQPPVINTVPPPDQGTDDTMLSPPAPNNTPQTPQTPADSPPSSVSSSQQDLSTTLQHLSLGDYVQSSSVHHTAVSGNTLTQSSGNNQSLTRSACDRVQSQTQDQHGTSGHLQNRELADRGQARTVTGSSGTRPTHTVLQNTDESSDSDE